MDTSWNAPQTQLLCVYAQTTIPNKNRSTSNNNKMKCSKEYHSSLKTGYNRNNIRCSALCHVIELWMGQKFDCNVDFITEMTLIFTGLWIKSSLELKWREWSGHLMPKKITLDRIESISDQKNRFLKGPHNLTMSKKFTKWQVLFHDCLQCIFSVLSPQSYHDFVKIRWQRFASFQWKQ